VGRGGHGGRGAWWRRGGHQWWRQWRQSRQAIMKPADGRLLRSRGPVPGSSASGKVFIPTNPFANPTELQALKESFAEQPNWKAAVMEGTTWEGSADENAAKWRKLNRIDDYCSTGFLNIVRIHHFLCLLIVARGLQLELFLQAKQLNC
jgi:hypothetical protein